MGGHHGHDHSHGHHHTNASGDGVGRAFALGVVLNGAFVVIELIAGVVADSVALIADGAHNFGDVLGLALAWGATRLAKRKPSARRTYGLRRSTIFASLANAIILLVGVGAVSWEAIERFRAPVALQGTTMMIFAAAGVAVNGGTALLFLRGSKTDVNVRGAFLHLAADAAVSVGVVIAGALINLTGRAWIDPVASLVVSLVILHGTWSLLKDAFNLALDAVPPHIDVDAVRNFLTTLPEVREVHDLHIWALSTTETALTSHLVMRDGNVRCDFLRDVAAKLDKDFGIHHTTLQLEPVDAPEDCKHAAPGAL